MNIYYPDLSDSDWRKIEVIASSLAKIASQRPDQSVKKSGLAIAQDTVYKLLEIVDPVKALWVNEIFQQTGYVLGQCPSCERPELYSDGEKVYEVWDLICLSDCE